MRVYRDGRNSVTTIEQVQQEAADEASRHAEAEENVRASHV